MSGSLGLVSRPCIAAASAAARATRPAMRAATCAGRATSATPAASGDRRAVAVAAVPGARRDMRVVARAKKGGFMAEIKEEEGEAVQFTLPLAIQKYPNMSLRNKNATVGVFDEELAKLSAAMFKLMYETEGVGLAAPQVGVNYRVMVYNEAGEPGKGKEVTLVNPKIVKFSKQKDLFEEGCLSFPKIYAEVEVRFARRPPERAASFCQPTPTPNPPARARTTIPGGSR